MSLRILRFQIRQVVDIRSGGARNWPKYGLLWPTKPKREFNAYRLNVTNWELQVAITFKEQNHPVFHGASNISGRFKTICMD